MAVWSHQMHMWLILSVHSPDTHHHPAAMQVIHCVMYPRTEYDLPILSFDMVGNNGRVSLVCIDPCPVAADRSLPPIYVSLVR